MTQELLGRVHRELIDVLNSINQDKIHHDGDDFHELLNDVEKALAQPEQEPVKWSDYEPDGMHHNKPQKRPQNCGTGYCSCIECVMEPPQRTWVGLSDEERKDIELSIEVFGTSVEDILKETEAKLKEKNT